MHKFFLMILCVSLLGACTMNSDAPKVTTTNDKVSNSYTDDINNTSKKITDSDEFRACMKQEANMCIQQAGSDLARKLKDPVFCKELGSQEQQDGCIFGITVTNAQEKQDDKLCDTLTNVVYLNQCKISIYQQSAISKKDINVCNKIDFLKNPTPQNMNDISIAKDQCIMQYIMNAGDTKEVDCERIQDKTGLDMCKVFIKNNNSKK